MIIFKADFTYDDIDYSVNIQKIPSVENLPVQWHAFDIVPEISMAPNPYIFAYLPETKIFSFEIFNHSVELGNAIFNSISKYCSDHQLPLTI